MYLADGLLLNHYEEGYDRICEKMSWLPGASKFNPNPYLEPTKHGYSMALSHMGAQFGGTSPSPFQRYIWILVSMEYFTNWVEVVPLRIATRGVVANFIKDNIIARFWVPHRVISDNNTLFVNREVRKMLEYYQVKHH